MSAFRFLLFLAVAPGWQIGSAAEPVATAALHNVFRLATGFYSGDAPESAKAFRELTRLGVRTVISVDGSQPRLTLAHQYGIGYVHLPFGYDGIPRSRAIELIKAVRGVKGPVYLHCHHGKHRGPAAAATVCRATQGWSAGHAEEFLKQAGTDPDFAGLYWDVRAFRPPSAEELARLPATFPETVDTPALVDAMVEIDGHLDALKVLEKAGWPRRGGPLAPAQPAVLIRELLRELARDPEIETRGAGYRAQLSRAEQAAETLHHLLEDGSDPAREAALKTLSSTCNDCHKAHRNPPRMRAEK